MSDSGGSNGNEGRTPPMVPGTFFFGNALQLKKRPIDFLVDAAAEYGPVFRLKGPGVTATVVTGTDGGELVRHEAECGLHRRDVFHAFSTEAGVDIFGVQGETHERLRALLKLGYSRQILAQFVPEMAQVVREHVKQWRPGQELRLFEVMSEIALHAVMRAVTPIDLRHLTRDIIRFGNDVMRVVTHIRPKLILWHPAYRQARSRVNNALEEVIERHRAGEFAQLPSMYMIDAFMHATNPQGDGMTDRDIRGGCAYGLCGTEIYLGRLAGFVLFELLRNNTLLERVRMEVDAASAAGEIDPKLFRRMPYLRGTYFETLRAYPLVPGLPFRAERDIALNGFTIPKGDLVLITPLPAHFSFEKYSNPMAFDANRCMRPRDEHLGRGAFAPFGMGQRVCLAAGMSEIVTLTIVSIVVRELDLALISPTYRMIVAPIPLIAPSDGVPISVVARRTPPKEITKEVLMERSDLVHAIEEKRVDDAIPEIEAVTFEARTTIIEQGAVADYFYILLDGTVSVIKTDETTGEAHVVNNLGAGQSFGEIGLLKNVTRQATVRATTRARVLRLDRSTFMELLTETDLLGDELGAVLQERFMRTIFATAVPTLDEEALRRYAPEFGLRGYQAGDVIIRQGDPAGEFYIVAVGAVDVEREMDDGSIEHLARLGPGSFFGEIGILNRQPRNATVKAVGTVEVMFLDREHFLTIVGESRNIKEDVALTVCRRLFSNIVDDSL